MVFSLNCIILGDTTTFPITLGKIVILDDIQYDISEFRISNLKRYIFSKKKESKLNGISDPDDLNLWQVNVSKDKLEGVYTTEHITNERRWMRPRLDFNNIPLDLGQSPTQLLHTGGCFWDYQESSELEQELRKEVRGLYNRADIPILSRYC
ncbi:P-loop containing nucleoside triphosphate hydrolase protein [Rhizophagus irregularis DAOM 181602=DAOM 197198]|nr:P-loop containing nucleoside triphosphate hydrolase protein [Rhizophagus irregularis DAOM 181602=DAOM 197198]